MTGPINAPDVSSARLDAKALVLVGLLALVVSAPSLLNGFAYDDIWIIVNNPRVHGLSRWADWFTTSYWPTREGSLYRPLTTTGFALQWWIGGGTPFVFHLLNVALYVAGTVAVTRLAALVLPASAALIVGALFAVHPAHVEATANVVGQSELWVGLIMVSATFIYVRARRGGPLSKGTIVSLAALYLTGALFKEHALTLPAWFAVAELTVLRDVGGSMRERAKSLAPLAMYFAVVVLIALVARWAVLGALGGDLSHPAMRGVGAGGRVLMMLGVLPDLARLLVWPAQLYADYSPDHVIVLAELSRTQINGLIVAIGFALIVIIAWRQSRPAAFGLLVASAAWLPTANILFPSGILLAERTLYMPTAGVLIAVGTAIAWVQQRVANRASIQQVAGALVALVLVLGSVRSIDRAGVWRSSPDLFMVMRRDEPESFRARYAWGDHLFSRGDLRGGERELRAAIRIFPNYGNTYEDLAHRYREHGLCPAAIPLYETAIRLDPKLWPSRQGLVACQLGLAQFRAARRSARLAMLQEDGLYQWFKRRLASADSALAANDSLSR